MVSIFHNSKRVFRKRSRLLQNDPSPKREGCGTAIMAFRTLPVGGTIAMMGKQGADTASALARLGA